MEPLWAKYRLNWMNEKLANPTAIAASKNARGTALPVMPAASEPLSAIAAVGAIMPMESAMASMKESSRRSVPSRFCIDYLLVRIVSKGLFGHGCLWGETMTVDVQG